MSKLASVVGCEVFSAGVHRGLLYTMADVQQMVENFTVAGSRLRVPLVIGHSEDQSWLRDTGLPAAGWITRLYRRGAKLFADFDGIPPTIAKLINGRAYRKVSAEVYDEPPDGSPPGCRGRMLRRVALLGGDLPQIKTLADLPLAEYAEAVPICSPWRIVIPVDARHEDRRGCVTYFAEAVNMADDAVQQVAESAIKAKWPDLPDEFLATLTPDQYAALAPAIEGAAPEVPPDETAPPMAEWPEGLDRDGVIAELVAMGEDAAALAAMSDDELVALYQSKKGATDTGAAPMSERNRKTRGATPVISPAQFAEMQRQAATLKRDLAQLQTSTRQRIQAERQRTVEAYCERWQREGYVLPREVDRTAKVPNLYHRLLNADAGRVRKYGEKTLSDFDAIVAEIEERGPGFARRYFSEKVTQHSEDGPLADIEKQASEYAAKRNRERGFTRN